MLTLDQIDTVAFAGIVLFLGYGIRRVVPFLGRYNIPAPVIGGLLVGTDGRKELNAEFHRSP